MFNAIATPFGMLLMWLYELVNSYALALVLIAIIVRVILLPVQMKSKRGTLRQTRLSPKIAELKKKHGANTQKFNEETQKLYKEAGTNPASGCLWGFIQMPIMLALFWAIRQPITLMMRVYEGFIQPYPFVHDGITYESGPIYERLYETGYQFVENGNALWEELFQVQWITDHWAQFSEFAEIGLRQLDLYLGFLNLGDIPQWQLWNFDWSTSAQWGPLLILFFFPIISGAAQFVSAAIMRKSQPMQQTGGMASAMKMMPLMSVFFGYMFPAALSIYWTTGTVLQIGQDIWLTKKYTKILDAEDAEIEKARAEKEAALEEKRAETEAKKAAGLIEQNKNTSKKKKKAGAKQEQSEKTAEWERENLPAKAKKAKQEPVQPSRVGDRVHARGRAYDPDRYKGEL